MVYVESVMGVKLIDIYMMYINDIFIYLSYFMLMINLSKEYE
jgi:hypothetical protein